MLSASLDNRIASQAKKSIIQDRPIIVLVIDVESYKFEATSINFNVLGCRKQMKWATFAVIKLKCIMIN